MDVKISVTEPQVEQEDYFLDLDADAEVEDFDFKLDGAYDTSIQYDTTEATARDSANQAADFEIGYEDDEAQTAPAEDGYMSPGKMAAQDGNEDMSMGYQDEIGYDDEEPSTTDGADKAGLEEANALDLEISTKLPEEHDPEDHDENRQVFNGQTEPAEAKPAAAAGGDPTPEGPSEELVLHDDLGDHEEHISSSGGNPDASIAAVDDRGADQSLIPTHENKSAAGSTVSSDVDKTNALPGFPGIEVHYNNGQYSLFGTPADDPDSYFLSDTKELEGPLTQFLASLRAVVSDEITDEDELLVRLDALSFEFGEKSSKRFLCRSLRDILGCYAAIASKQAESPQNLVLTLLIRRDCEDRFLELLEDAGIPESSSATAYLSGDFENMDKASQAGTGGDEYPYQGSSVDDYSEEYEDEDEDLAASLAYDNSVQTPASGKQTGPDESLENSDFTEEISDPVTNLSGPASVDSTHIEPTGEISYEEEYQEVQFEDYENAEDAEEAEEDYADEDIDISGEPNEQFAADEISFEIAGPSALAEDEHNSLDNETGGEANIDVGTTAAAASALATTAPESALNGNSDFFSSATHDFSHHGHLPGFSLLGEIDGGELIDYSEDEGPLVSVFPTQAKRKSVFAEQKSPKRMKFNKEALAEESWRIQYSDDEDDTSHNTTSLHHPSPIHSPATNEATVDKGTRHIIDQESPSLPKPSVVTSCPSLAPQSLTPKGARLPLVSSGRDDQVNFSLDADPGLGTVQEQDGGDDFTDAFDIMEDAGNNAEETDSPQHGGLNQDTSEASSNNGLASNSPLSGAHGALTQEALSSHTSRTSTINGDEIDYDETNTANESVLEAGVPHQEVTPIGHENDEIDWENDGDEEEEEQAVAPTSPSISGKRSRTDEVEEGLVDETDYKRRRT
ncbi:hypothetical protein B0H67DRAFT_288071 [Lasiosphaeris hirsuta]|uniref:Uncharacterized protein n=1 Tax=Lasiosphaeris hirsuta TaxID=260670 RepID=A0AA40DPM3_9PEZI|nr:hypothetical protein B0H67DRAFT_288071 [Lasiosphaeris hirsuta]